MFKFTDDTTVVGLIPGNNQSPYRNEVLFLVDWCCPYNLELNISKTKELVVNFRKDGKAFPADHQFHWPSMAWRWKEWTAWSFSESSPVWNGLICIIKKANQRLFSLHQLKKFGVSREGMLQLYRAAIEGVLTFSISVWYDNSKAEQRKQLDRIVCSTSKIISCNLTPISDIYETHIQREGLKILQYSTHPANPLLITLPSGKGSGTSKLRHPVSSTALTAEPFNY